MLHNLCFFSSKCRLFHNATFFGSYIILILNRGVLNFKGKFQRQRVNSYLHFKESWCYQLQDPTVQVFLIL